MTKQKKNKTDNGSSHEVKIIQNYEEAFNSKSRLNPLRSTSFNNIIKNLSTPRFLGSYHLKEADNPQFKPIENLLRGNLQFKYSKSLRSIVFNPITITLIVIALVFNLFLLFTILF
ncbi:MAG: hypothetical protein ACFFBH_08255 [Promethearchaeota archaeon]